VPRWAGPYTVPTEYYCNTRNSVLAEQQNWQRGWFIKQQNTKFHKKKNKISDCTVTLLTNCQEESWYVSQ